ncbi:hypothetical protein CDL15_Pgr023185 [Punica granatum]|uniref:Uncharacterized protein n=1 Tax=Punica granatum TaxID=22663 RepID=A0A218X4A6_PUNGR|nr:hypothetical protein CDL15_Pgr023185 [Punica granatum]
MAGTREVDVVAAIWEVDTGVTLDVVMVAIQAVAMVGAAATNGCCGHGLCRCCASTAEAAKTFAEVLPQN